jgi:hypothetical protein
MQSLAQLGCMSAAAIGLDANRMVRSESSRHESVESISTDVPIFASAHPMTTASRGPGVSAGPADAPCDGTSRLSYRVAPSRGSVVSEDTAARRTRVGRNAFEGERRDERWPCCR